MNIELDHKNRTLEVSLLITKDELYNASNSSNNNDYKLKQYSQNIKCQEEMIASLTNELIKERKENEINKNKLSVCLIQMRNLDTNVKGTLDEKNFMNQK